MTNGDKIRAMTDDVDLAIFLDSVRSDGIFKDDKFPCSKFGWLGSKFGWLDWLKAEAEEDKNG